MIAVIGAGVSGLSCAWWLRRQGAEVVVYEADDRVGGKVSTEGGAVLREEGPHTLLADEELLQWLQSLGLSPVWPSQAGAVRHVLLDGCYRRLPEGPLQLLGGNLLSWGGKWKVIRGMLRPGAGSAGLDSVATFCDSRFGSEVLAKVLDPMVGGVFAGDPQELRLQEALPELAEAAQCRGPFLSGLLKMRKRMEGRRACTLQGGLQQLPLRLAAELDVRLNCPVTALRREGAGWRLRTAAGWERAQQVVLALPAAQAATLLHPLAPALADACRRIPYAPLAVVSTLLEADALEWPLEGGGALHPEAEGMLTLGHLSVSNSYPHVCPDGTQLLTSFIGGRRHPERMELSDAEMLLGLNREMAERFGLRARPVSQRVTRWPAALPQGTSLQGRVRRMAQPLAGQGLHVCANWLDGVSLADCLRKGRRLAARLGGVGRPGFA
ncbi:protoporphyrinogen oxidase [Chromobacterium alticapitis]|uniref:Protoporphyrinogen oxidase n=1 Tax=Chromobacterium alticapitis TaxID=2073169 RepID=A0A2S5DC10_9NEIS|nr:protoporphyrinogen oxidase [Chromobacterium alticapitis]POZ60551.1 protoporphyrinogen oxidase [Chromobacterium alticapitis]